MPSGWVEGIVRKGSDNTPVGGAIVTVDGTSGSYTTGSDGYYIKTLTACSPNPPCTGYTVRAKKSYAGAIYEGVVNGVHIAAYNGTWRDITIPGL